MSNEGWLTDGKCDGCRRREYCKKECRAHRERMREMIASHVASSYGAQLAKLGHTNEPQEVPHE